MHSLEEMRQVNQQMVEMKHRNMLQTWAIAIGGVVVLVVCVMLYFIHRKNRVLRRANKVLYEKTQENLRHDTPQEQELAVSTSAAQQEVSADFVHKYQNSTLDEDTKKVLMAKILEVMRTSPEIYATDFSANRLSELVGESYKHLSQVINEYHGDNFNALLNEYRIREACRRINADPYTNLTIEAIANSVGFNSRNGFRNAFKKFTGLNPSEYIRIAREGDKA